MAIYLKKNYFKKIYKKNKRGFTLIELIIYMSIYMIIVFGIFQSIYILEKNIEENSKVFDLKKDIYKQLYIIQYYLNKADLFIINNEQKSILIETDKLKFRQYVDESGYIHFHYLYKNNMREIDFILYDNIYFKQFSFEKDKNTYISSLFRKSIINVFIEFREINKKNNNKNIQIKDWLFSLP